MCKLGDIASEPALRGAVQAGYALHLRSYSSIDRSVSSPCAISDYLARKINRLVFFSSNKTVSYNISFLHAEG